MDGRSATHKKNSFLFHFLSIETMGKPSLNRNQYKKSEFWDILPIMSGTAITFPSEDRHPEMKIYAMKLVAGGQSCHQVIY